MVDLEKPGEDLTHGIDFGTDRDDHRKFHRRFAAIISKSEFERKTFLFWAFLLY